MSSISSKSTSKHASQGQAPKVIQGYSNVSRLMAMDITEADAEKGFVQASFYASDDFTNSIGNVQGGILTAMLDDLMGYALGITLPDDEFSPTANLNVSFLKPVAVGKLWGRGEVLKRDGQVYILAAKLYNAQEQMVASATAKAKRGRIVKA